MNNSFYVGAAAQVALIRQSSVIAGNAANSNTSGYKSEHILFKNYVQKAGNEKVYFNNDYGIYRNSAQGNLSKTGNDLDVSITGEGFFALQTPEGVRYTRNGSFTLSNAGTVINSQGHQLLDQNNQPITINATGDLQINTSGSVLVNNEQIAKIGIFKFANIQSLQNIGNLFIAKNPPAVADIGKYTVRQGFLEDSNVITVNELTKLNEIQRSVASMSNNLTNIDEMLRSAVRTIAKLG
jgi:flagellar basal-body rod protein FlgF